MTGEEQGPAATEATWITVGGARIEVLIWGNPDAPGLLLAHGYAANAHWWLGIAPILAKSWRVVAFSFSGMGQSDWRPEYTLRHYVQEIEEVARLTGLFDGKLPPMIAAHSFGGCGALLSVTEGRCEWGGLVLIDSRVDDSFSFLTKSEEAKLPRLTTDRDELVARFRLIPAQQCRNPGMFALAAHHSVRHVQRADGDKGWCWAADPALFISFEGQQLLPVLPRISCPVAFVVGAESYLIEKGHLSTIRQHLPADTPLSIIPDAGHHVILDQPDAVAHLLQNTLSGWLD
jgi:pimeloyl-ACP methyl ester carboxylesterase